MQLFRNTDSCDGGGVCGRDVVGVVCVFDGGVLWCSGVGVVAVVEVDSVWWWL